MDKGLKELQTAAQSAIVLKAESSFLLSWIYISFENKLPESLSYSKNLSDSYPGNPLYSEIYLRNLLIMKKYDEADKLISGTSDEQWNKYFKAQFVILKGILQEKKYHNNNLAEEYYNLGISELSLYGKYGNEYSAYAYFGLSRISDDNRDKHTRKTYRKEAIKLADFKKINFDK
jgi:hypothetical protein